MTEPVVSQSSSYEMAPSSGYGSIGTVIIDDLLRAILEDRDPLASGRDVVQALAAVDAMYEAAATKTRTPVSIPAWRVRS